jgi:hypothetical protein
MVNFKLSNAERKRIYRRDGYRCALCDSTRGIQLHHVISRAQGGPNTAMNLITLCWRCHAIAHGTVLPECPNVTPEDIELGSVQYLADRYAEDGIIWNPWTGGR